MSEYNPWKFILLLPVIMLLEGLHIVCEIARMFDENVLYLAGENLEEWLRD